MSTDVYWATHLQEKMIRWASSLNIPILTRNNFDSFEFNFDETPFMHIQWPLIFICAYCFGIPFLQTVMKNRKPPPLKWILVVHNLFLSVSSFCLMAFLAISLIHTKHKFNLSVWDFLYNLTFYQQKGPLFFVFYVNYLFKYYELIDTIFLALKKKEIGFLHAYHHPATLVLAWAGAVDTCGFQWLLIFFNLCVHSVMYLYYLMSALKIPMPWKRLVTILQISQFVGEISIGLPGLGPPFALNEGQGSERTLAIGMFIIFSYLRLFIDFYNETYGKKEKKRKLKDK